MNITFLVSKIGAIQVNLSSRRAVRARGAINLFRPLETSFWALGQGVSRSVIFFLVCSSAVIMGVMVIPWLVMFDHASGGELGMYNSIDSSASEEKLINSVGSNSNICSIEGSLSDVGSVVQRPLTQSQLPHILVPRLLVALRARALSPLIIAMCHYRENGH